ncbi:MULTISPECIES: hypothetical protein, partial [Protofrankia]
QGAGRWRGGVAVAALVGLDAVVVAALWPTLVRPLWYDEAWRAYHLSVGAGWFEALRTANAPLSGGWFAVEKLAAALGGDTELVLRAPQIVALVVLSLVTYLLGRWWLPRPAATVVAGLLTVNGGLLVYGLQLKSYLPEAACAAAVAHLWLCARRRAEAGRRLWPARAGMALCAVMAVTSLFVLAPLLLLDVVDAARAWWAHRPHRARSTATETDAAAPESARSRRRSRQGSRRRPRQSTWQNPRRRPISAGLAGSVLVGGCGLAHLVLFVLPQSYLTTNPYWRNFFLTRNNAAGQLRTALWELPRNAFTAAMTRPDAQFGSPFTGSPLLAGPDHRLHVCVIVGALVCWAAGLDVAVRDRAGRALLLALGGALALIAFASAAGRWPVGFVRANLFLLPLLYVLAGTGGSALLRSALLRLALPRSTLVRSTLVRPAPPWAAEPGPSRLWAGPGGRVLGRVTAVLLVGAVAMFVLAAGAVAAQRSRQVRASATGPLLLGDMRELVAVQRRTAEPGDVQVVIPGRWDERQWYKAQQYYARYHAGRTTGGQTTTTDHPAADTAGHPATSTLGPPVAEADTLVLPPLGWDVSIPPFLAGRPRAGTLYLVTYNLVFPDAVRGLHALLGGLGWCPDEPTRRSWPLTGEITAFTRCPPATPPSAPSPPPTPTPAPTAAPTTTAGAAA